MIFFVSGVGSLGQQEQQIDVGSGRQHAAAVAADRHDRRPRRGRQAGMKIARRPVVDRADQIVLVIGKARRAGASRAALLERPARGGAARLQALAKQLDRFAAERRVVQRRVAAQRFQPFVEPRAIEAAFGRGGAGAAGARARDR